MTFRYSGSSGLRPFFLTAAKRIKDSFPDVLIEKRILPNTKQGGDDSTFEVLVDDKIVLGKSRNRGVRRSSKGVKSVYVSMQELDLAIAKARRRRRPTTVYMAPKNANDDDESTGDTKHSTAAAVRLETLRRTKHQNSQPHNGQRFSNGRM